MSNEWSREVFAKNPAWYIKESGKTQKEIAEAVDVAPPSLNDWLSCKTYPRIGKIQRLADYFYILKSDLIEDKQKKPDENDGLSKSKRELIALARTLSEDQAAFGKQVFPIA